MPALYVFDALGLFILWGASLGFGDLRQFSLGLPTIRAGASTFALMGSLGIYGIRVSMFIAMLRRNRSPQVLEWLVCIVPLTITVLSFVTSGHLVQAYAAAHDYKFCYEQGRRGRTYTFASHSTPCPPEPKAH